MQENVQIGCTGYVHIAAVWMMENNGCVYSLLNWVLWMLWCYETEFMFMCKTRHEHAANEKTHKPRVHTRHDNMCITMCIREKHLFHNYISPDFKFLLSNESLDFCDFLNKRSKGLTMQINFHIIFTKGGDIFGHGCIYIYLHINCIFFTIHPLFKS